MDFSYFFPYYIEKKDTLLNNRCIHQFEVEDYIHDDKYIKIECLICSNYVIILKDDFGPFITQFDTEAFE